jgi:hypothetical protein
MYKLFNWQATPQFHVVEGCYHFGFNEKEREGSNIMAAAKFEIYKDKSKVTDKSVEFR